MGHEGRVAETGRVPENLLSRQIIGAAIEVHRNLGPGLLESVYEVCLGQELTLLGVPHARQVQLPITYKGVRLNADYRMDLLVADLVIVEVKSVGEVLPVHKAQLLTYLRLTGLKLGLLMNFNVPKLVDGVTRVANGL